ncbi:MAG TPA: hypothetical protein GXX76_01385 [Bacteroidales bacterium]|jgi:hypothetical protein|nr:hypothetical protein [Bacteroidales bacterium]
MNDMYFAQTTENRHELHVSGIKNMLLASPAPFINGRETAAVCCRLLHGLYSNTFLHATISPELYSEYYTVFTPIPFSNCTEAAAVCCRILSLAALC